MLNVFVYTRGKKTFKGSPNETTEEPLQVLDFLRLYVLIHGTDQGHLGD